MQLQITLLLLLLSLQQLSSQTLKFNYFLEMPAGKSQAMALGKQLGEDQVLVLKTSTDIHGLALDENFDVKHKLAYRNEMKGDFTILGVYTQYPRHLILTTDNKKQKFTFIRFDFATEEKKDFVFEKIFEKEYLLGIVSDDRNWYFLTVRRSSSILRLHTFSFDDELVPSHKVEAFDFNQENFSTEGFVRLSSLLIDVKSSGGKNNLSKVKSILRPGSARLMSMFNAYKLFMNGDHLHLSLDHDPSMTKLITIDLKTMKAEARDFPIDTKGNVRKSNAYVLGTYLYQLAVDKDECQVNVSDWKIGESVYSKKWNLSELPSSNSDEYRSVRKNSELAENDASDFGSQLKGNDYHMGIMARQANNQIQVIIGARFAVEMLAQMVNSSIITNIINDRLSNTDRNISFWRMNFDRDFQPVAIVQPLWEVAPVNKLQIFLEEKGDIANYAVLVSEDAVGFYDKNVKAFVIYELE